jgi:hypothetical protein
MDIRNDVYVIPDRCPIGPSITFSFGGRTICENIFFMLHPKKTHQLNSTKCGDACVDWTCAGCTKSMGELNDPNTCQFRKCGLGGKKVKIL